MKYLAGPTQLFIIYNNTNMKFKFDYQKPKVIAEIGCNHMGDLNIAKELIDLAYQAE